MTKTSKLTPIQRAQRIAFSIEERASALVDRIGDEEHILDFVDATRESLESLERIAAEMTEEPSLSAEDRNPWLSREGQ